MLPECDIELPAVELPAFFNHCGTNVGSLLSITGAKHYHVQRTSGSKLNFLFRINATNGLPRANAQFVSFRTKLIPDTTKGRPSPIPNLI